MKKIFCFLICAFVTGFAFAKTTGFMLRENGPLREDRGNGGVEWSVTVPAGTELEIESEEPVELTLITEKENYENIKFYKVTYEKKTYYARESEVALGGKLSVILDDTVIFTKPRIDSFINARLEKASVVVEDESVTSFDNLKFVKVMYWSESASVVRTRYVFADKLSSKKEDVQAVRIVERANSVTNSDKVKEKAMKMELFTNASKLKTSPKVAEYIEAEFEKLTGEEISEE